MVITLLSVSKCWNNKSTYICIVGSDILYFYDDKNRGTNDTTLMQPAMCKVAKAVK